jgi:hypothetical protein
MEREAMSGGIFLLQDDGQLVEMKEQKYDSEDLLQELIAKYPNLLAGDQIDNDNPRRWLLISREIHVPGTEDGLGRFSLDHLFLDQDGIPTLVEVKRSSDTRIRREVVGQMLDYAANAVAYWPLETLVSKFEQICEKHEKYPEEVLETFLDKTSEISDFWQNVKDNLRSGKIRLVFIADEIPSELKRIIEFLNEQMDPAEVLGVEIRQYLGKGLKTLVPRVVGQTQGAIQKKKASSPGKQWDETSYFLDIGNRRGDRESEIARRILDWANNNVTGIWWGKGKITGSFVPLFNTPEGIQHLLFAVFTNGTIQIYFQSYASRPVFDSEAKRLELLERLNAIPSVSIPPDGITRYPSIPLSSFFDEKNLRQFFSVYEWFLEELSVQADESKIP